MKMEPTKGSVRFGVEVSRLDRGYYAIGIYYENTKMFWEDIRRRYPDEYYEDGTEVNRHNLSILLIFFQITIGRFWRAEK